jgi:hypothetical protein
MKRSFPFVLGGLALCGAAALSLSRTTQAQQPAASVALAPPFTFMLSAKAPKGAVVLLSKDAKSLSENWLKRYSKDPANGTLDKAGVYTPNKSDITSRKEFGDHYLHLEFRCPEKGHGNAGVGLQGRYEVQIFNTAGEALDTHNGGALYDQTPAAYNASKKGGEWQTYDIVFRAPRFDAAGKVKENARASVYWNGVLVQNNGEFRGPTGIQYGEFRSEAPTGPIVLQGDHDVVQYRNIWVVTL